MPLRPRRTGPVTDRMDGPGRVHDLVAPQEVAAMMRRLALAVLVTAAAAAAPARAQGGGPVTLQHDDGSAAWSLNVDGNDVELVKFCPEGHGVITAIRVNTTAPAIPTDAEVRVWGNFGNYDVDWRRPLSPAMTWTVSAGGWSDVPVPAAGIRFDSPPCFWVGFHHRGNVDPRLMADDTECIAAPECTTSFIDAQSPGSYCLPNDQLSYVLITDDCNGDGTTGDYGDLDYLVHVDFTPDAESTPVFTDVTGSSAGMPRASRVAWGDYDGDHDEDLHLDGRLFRNDGTGSFENVSAAAFPGLGSSGGGGMWADYDNDGRLDLFAFGMADRLWRNLGDGTFQDVTALAGEVDDGLPTEAVGWADFDRDGFVDLYKANYEDWNGGAPIYFRDVLLRNMGDGRFADVTAAAGMGAEIAEPLAGRGVNWGDFDGDGCIDLHVSNYRLNPNLLYRNECDGTFTEVGAATGVRGTERSGSFAGAYGHTIGSQWADFDNDLDLDLLQGQLRHQWGWCFQDPTFLWRNDVAARGVFEEIHDVLPIEYQEGHSDVAWGDVDADGDLDFYVTHVYSCQPAQLYLNEALEAFRNVTRASGLLTLNGWGVAMADADGDGDLDVFTRGLQRNDGPGGRSLQVRLVGNLANGSAIGARLVLEDAWGRRHLREVEGGKGTGTQSSLTQHFGLGTATATRLTVTWPSSCSPTIIALPPSQGLIEVRESCGRLRRGVAPDALVPWRTFDPRSSVVDAEALPESLRFYDTTADATLFVLKDAASNPEILVQVTPWRVLR